MKQLTLSFTPKANKKKLVKKGLTLPDIDMQNVMLNAVYAITRSMVSIQDNKNDKTRELVCILEKVLEGNVDLVHCFPPI